MADDVASLLTWRVTWVIMSGVAGLIYFASRVFFGFLVSFIWLPSVICCHCWRRRRQRSGSVILLGIGGARKGLWCFWSHCWTGACWSIVAAEGEGTMDGGRRRSVALPLLRWITSLCWLWWVCGWLWLVVCDTGLDAEVEGLLWRCYWSMSEVVNRCGSVGWCSGLLGGGGSAVVIGWGAADGKGAAADSCRWWWTVTILISAAVCLWKRWTVFPFFSKQNSRTFLFLFVFFRSNQI
jgi:hypothetical protein